MKSTLAKAIICLLPATGTVVGQLRADSCGPCDSCPNALVRVAGAELSGDIPETFPTDLEGNIDTGQVLNMLLRGFDYLEFRKLHPCADIYYVLDTGLGPLRVGPKQGEAKYEIRSEVIVENMSGLALVSHETPSGIQPAAVERQGTIQVDNKLIALKNGMVYDSSGSVLDWVTEPPAGENYFYNDGSESIGGTSYEGNDGLVVGQLNEGDILGHPIEFERGDIGVLIRKKETPKQATVLVEDKKFPPEYKLRIDNITNFFDEILPDEVLIALRPEQGHITGNESSLPLRNWLVYRTSGGRVVDDVLYQPPDCRDAREDKLRIAGVCQFHDGPLSVCTNPITTRVVNNQCYDLNARFVRQLTRRGDMHRTETSQEPAFVEGHYKARLREDIRITVQMGLEQESVRVRDGVIRENYRCKTMNYSLTHSLQKDVEAYSRLTWQSSLFTEKYGVHSTPPKPAYPCENERLTLLMDEKDRTVKALSWSPTVLEYTVHRSHKQRWWTSDGGLQRDALDRKEEHSYLSVASDKALSEAAQTRPPLSGFRVLFGDGNYFGGRVEETKEVRDREVSEGVEEKDVFLWDMTRRPGTDDGRP